MAPGVIFGRIRLPSPAMEYRAVSIGSELGDTSTKEHLQAKGSGMAKAAQDDKAVTELGCLQGKGPWSQAGSEWLHTPNHGHGGTYPWGWAVCGEQVLWLGLLGWAGGSQGPALLQKSVVSDRQGLLGQVLHVLDFRDRAWESSWAYWVNCKSAGMSTTAL